MLAPRDADVAAQAFPVATPEPIPAELLRLAERIRGLDVESRRILRRFMGLGEDEVIFFDAEDIRPRRMVADGLLMWRSLKPEKAGVRSMLPYYLEPNARVLLNSHPELCALSADELASVRRDGESVRASPTDSLIERLSQMDAESKSLLRRFQAGGLNSIIYLSPEEGPPRPLIDHGAIVRVSGARRAGSKEPYELGRAAREALRARPDIIR